MKRLSFIFSMLFLISTAIPANAKEWTSNTGTKIHAELISYSQGLVILKAEDDRIIKLPLSRLASKDQSYIANMNHQNTAQNNELAQTAEKEKFSYRDFSLAIRIGFFVLLSGLIWRKLN